MAEFSQLGLIAIDPVGNLYVWESDSARIRQVKPDGTTRTLATNVRNVGGLAADASPATVAWAMPATFA